MRGTSPGADDRPPRLSDFLALRAPDGPEFGRDSIALRVEDLRKSGRSIHTGGTRARLLADQLPAELQSDINDLRERIGMEPLDH